MIRFELGHNINVHIVEKSIHLLVGIVEKEPALTEMIMMVVRLYVHIVENQEFSRLTKEGLANPRTYTDMVCLVNR